MTRCPSPAHLRRLLPVLLVSLAVASCGGTKKEDAPSQSAARSAAADADAVASIDGKPITDKELREYMGPRMLQLERRQAAEKYQLRREALDDLVAKRLIDDEAARRNVSPEALLADEMQQRMSLPSHAELLAFYDQNRERIGNQPFDAVRPQIAQYLQQQKYQENLVAYLNQLKSARKVEVTLPPPELPRVEVAAEGPTRGGANAPVTVVVFSDFQCPHCSRAVPLLDEIARVYGDKVKIVFRDFPLPNHSLAPKAAEAGHCADEQGKFWAMHDAMFKNQDKLAPEGLKEVARGAGLDGGAFDQCIDSGRMASRVQKNVEAGRDAGVGGTPAIFINGQMVGGAQEFQVFKALIDRELERAGKAS